MIKDTQVTYNGKQGTVIDDNVMYNAVTGEDFHASTVRFADGVERINDADLSIPKIVIIKEDVPNGD